MCEKEGNFKLYAYPSFLAFAFKSNCTKLNNNNRLKNQARYRIVF